MDMLIVKKLLLSYLQTKVERENNLREFKLSHNIDLMPKYGAGSEFGREQKEEARRKKYGIMKKRYNPEAQPWLMKMGAGKQTRKLVNSIISSLIWLFCAMRLFRHIG